jgi:hypothetical protein
MAGLSWHAKTSKIVRFEDEAVRIWCGQDSLGFKEEVAQ